MRCIYKYYILFFAIVISLPNIAQDTESEYKLEELYGKWILKEVINSDILKLCENGENITYIFKENTLEVYEVDNKTGCQNGLVNDYPFEFNGSIISLWDGNVLYKIINLTEDELTLKYKDQTEVYKKIE